MCLVFFVDLAPNVIVAKVKWRFSFEAYYSKGDGCLLSERYIRQGSPLADCKLVFSAGVEMISLRMVHKLTVKDADVCCFNDNVSDDESCLDGYGAQKRIDSN